MAGFRLTGGGGGCPPTETPPSTYQNPFRFDSAGRLWLKDCFQGIDYLGEARHDINTNELFGTASVPVSTNDDLIAGNGITAGTYTNFNYTNNTACSQGIMIGMELNADVYVNQSSFAVITLSARLNGANVSRVAGSSVYLNAGSDGVRSFANGSAGPHYITTLAPGQAMTIGCRLFLGYYVGSPDGVDQFNSANSIVRVYGYTLD